MKALIETRNRRTERVFLVGVELKSRNGSESDDSLEELAELDTYQRFDMHQRNSITSEWLVVLRNAG